MLPSGVREVVLDYEFLVCPDSIPVDVTLMAIVSVDRSLERVNQDIVTCVRTRVRNGNPGVVKGRVLDHVSHHVALQGSRSVWVPAEPLLDLDRLDAGESIESWLVFPLEAEECATALRVTRCDGGSTVLPVSPKISTASRNPISRSGQS